MNSNLIRLTGALTLALLLSFASCGKDGSTKTISKASLIARNWIQTDLLAAQAGTPEVSVFNSFFEACDKDNIWQFSANGTYTVVEGSTKCVSTDPNVVSSGTWQLTENETKIIIDDSAEPAETLTIRELTSTSFRISGTQVSNGTTFTATIVFTAQ